MEAGSAMLGQEEHMNEVPEVRRFRASLIGNADTSAGWRYRKAREFPWDARNVESAKSLRRLYTALNELPAGDALWERYAAVWATASDDDCHRLAEIEHEMLHSYGFSFRGASGSAETFLSDLVNALECGAPALASAARVNGAPEARAPSMAH
jgi:hypothetical protein